MLYWGENLVVSNNLPHKVDVPELKMTSSMLQHKPSQNLQATNV